MSNGSPEWTAGQGVSHPEMGPGVFIATEPGGYARVFFQQVGERRVPVTALNRATSWEERGCRPGPTGDARGHRAIMAGPGGGATPFDGRRCRGLTAAKVDFMLPHQIVLTYRVANASPRRFLDRRWRRLGKDDRK